MPLPRPISGPEWPPGSKLRVGHGWPLGVSRRGVSGHRGDRYNGTPFVRTLLRLSGDLAIDHTLLPIEDFDRI